VVRQHQDVAGVGIGMKKSRGRKPAGAGGPPPGRPPGTC
jgi:hypothetical protein